MNLKSITVPKYLLKDDFGEYECYRVEVLVDAGSPVSADEFDQVDHEHYLADDVLARLSKEIAQRFLNENYKYILQGKRELTARELNGIRAYLGLNGSQFARLLNLTKSSVSRIIAGKQALQADTMLLAVEKLRNELEVPGTTCQILMQYEPREEFSAQSAVAAEVVAEWLIRRFTELEECITHLKLQKLLYYSQGLALGHHDVRLIEEDFFAWNHGPVIESLYHKYKGFGSGPLAISPAVDVTQISENALLSEILERTMTVYGRYTAWVLREKTHCESPWLETAPNEVITIDKLQQFFRGVVV